MFIPQRLGFQFYSYVMYRRLGCLPHHDVTSWFFNSLKNHNNYSENRKLNEIVFLPYSNSCSQEKRSISSLIMKPRM